MQAHLISFNNKRKRSPKEQDGFFIIGAHKNFSLKTYPPLRGAALRHTSPTVIYLDINFGLELCIVKFTFCYIKRLYILVINRRYKIFCGNFSLLCFLELLMSLRASFNFKSPVLTGTWRIKTFRFL